MFYNKLIKYFYIFLSFLIVFTPVNYNLVQFIPAFLFLWMLFFLFCLSHNNKKTIQISTKQRKDIDITNSKVFLILSIIFAIIFIPIYVKFYTGSSILVSLKRYFSGDALGVDSTYYLYQQHFKESGLNEFTVQKVPFILGNGLLNFIFWIWTIKIIGYTRKISLLEAILLLTFFILYLLKGISRGTSFENFQVLFIIVYSILFRFSYLHKSSWIKGKSKVVLYSLITLSTFSFIFSKSIRYSDDLSIYDKSVTSTLIYDRNHFIAQYFPLLGSLLMDFAGYFLFGLYVISNALNSVLLNGTFKGILATLLPFGLQITDYSDSYRDFLCGNVIDCGAAWIPDSLIIIQNLGLFIFIPLIYIIGKIAYLSYIRAMKGELWFAILLYIIVYFMFSLPVGNFITASSSIILSILFLLICYYKPFRLKIFKLKYIKL